MYSQQFWKFIYELLVTGKYELYSINQQYDIAVLVDKSHQNYYYFDGSSRIINQEDILETHLHLSKQLPESYHQAHYYYIDEDKIQETIMNDDYHIIVMQSSLEDIAKSFKMNVRKLNTKEGTNYLQKIIQPEVYDKINIMKYPATYFTAMLVILVFLCQCLVQFIYHEDLLILLGGSNYIAMANYHEYYRAITAIFIHDDILHVLFNTFALISMGRFVERVVNKVQWFILFFTVGIIANVVASYWIPEYILIGASGAICSFIGAMLYISLVDSYFKKTPLSKELLATMVGITIFGLSLGNVSHTAHFTGFIGGFILMMLLRGINPNKQ